MQARGPLSAHSTVCLEASEFSKLQLKTGVCVLKCVYCVCSIFVAITDASPVQQNLFKKLQVKQTL